jgi:hypothetical protein
MNLNEKKQPKPFGWVSGREEYEVTDYQPNATVEATNFAQPVQRVR